MTDDTYGQASAQHFSFSSSEQELSALQHLKTPVDLLGLPPAITEAGNRLYLELSGAGRAQDLSALALEEARADGFLMGLQAAGFGEVVDQLRTNFTGAAEVSRVLLG